MALVFQGSALFPWMWGRWVGWAWWENSRLPREIAAHGEGGQMSWCSPWSQASQAWFWEHDVCAERCRYLSGLGETSATQGGVSLSGCMQVGHPGGTEHHLIYNWLAIPYLSPSPLHWTLVSIIYSLIIIITQCITCCAYRSSQYTSLLA